MIFFEYFWNFFAKFFENFFWKSVPPLKKSWLRPWCCGITHFTAWLSARGSLPWGLPRPTTLNWEWLHLRIICTVLTNDMKHILNQSQRFIQPPDSPPPKKKANRAKPVQMHTSKNFYISLDYLRKFRKSLEYLKICRNYFHHFQILIKFSLILIFFEIFRVW